MRLGSFQSLQLSGGNGRVDLPLRVQVPNKVGIRDVTNSNLLFA